jgi:hypothetical protein
VPLNIFDGSSWNPFKKAQVFDGSQWSDAKSIQIYNGSQWQAISSLVPVNTATPTATWLIDSISTLPDYGVGQTVTIAHGDWTNNPSTYTYKWYKAPYNVGNKLWSLIDGVTSNQYQLPAELVGYYIKVEVFAENQYGKSAAATYNMPDQAFICPQGTKNLSSQAISNTQATITWDASLGANGYYIQYWQAGVYHDVRLESYVRSYTIDTTNYDPQYGIGVFFAPTNNISPASPGGTWYMQGSARNANILDIRPNKPTVGLAYYNSQNPDGSYGALFGYATNIGTITGYSINQIDSYYPVGNVISSSSDRVNEQLYMTQGQSLRYTITFYGLTPGFTQTSWTSSIITVVIPSPVPSGGITVLLPAGDQHAGTQITASTVSWDYNPSSYYTYIMNNSGSVVASTYGNSVSYTINTGDVDYSRTFRAYAVAYNATGASDPIGSNTVNAVPDIVYTYGTSYNYRSVYINTTSSCDGQYVATYDNYVDYYRSELLANGVGTGTYREDASQNSAAYRYAMLVDGQCGYKDCTVCALGYSVIYPKADSRCTSGQANYKDCITHIGCTDIPIFVSCQACGPCQYTYTNQTRSSVVCASGQEYYTLCVTYGSCSNTTTTTGCVPAATSGKGLCLSYDVTNSASAFYYDCYSVGQCATHTTNNRTPC